MKIEFHSLLTNLNYLPTFQTSQLQSKMKSTSSTATGKSSLKTEDGEKKSPLFLHKTFAMLKTAKPDIATWSDDGLSFYIIDQARFVEVVIPQYFKHNNFSSFVRQLNFYGFRKVWSDQLIEMVTCQTYFYMCSQHTSSLIVLCFYL